MTFIRCLSDHIWFGPSEFLNGRWIPPKLRKRLLRFYPPASNKVENPEFQPRHAPRLEYSQFTLQHIHTTHLMPLTDCCFNKMGVLYATSSYDRTAQIWDTETGKNVQRLTGHIDAVYSCRFNLPDGNLLGTGSFDQRAAIWNVSSGECLHMMSGHAKEVVSVQFDPVSKLLATGSLDSTARVWDVECGEVMNVFQEHTKEIMTVDFHPSDPLLLTSSFDHTARLWDLRTGECASAFRGHKDALCGAYYGSQGMQIVSGSLDQTARIWDVRQALALHVLRGHEGEVVTVCFSIDGTTVAPDRWIKPQRSGPLRQGMKLRRVPDIVKRLQRWCSLHKAESCLQALMITHVRYGMQRMELAWKHLKVIQIVCSLVPSMTQVIGSFLRPRITL
jgi:WD40 repeat protein